MHRSHQSQCYQSYITNSNVNFAACGSIGQRNEEKTDFGLLRQMKARSPRRECSV